jgi:hypothetical protein
MFVVQEVTPALPLGTMGAMLISLTHARIALAPSTVFKDTNADLQSIFQCDSFIPTSVD